MRPPRRRPAVRSARVGGSRATRNAFVLGVKPMFRGLHSSTFRLNLSDFCGIGGAFRGCVGSVQEVSGGIKEYHGCVLCHKRLRLS